MNDGTSFGYFSAKPIHYHQRIRHEGLNVA
jgi:hypothetical protein